MGLVEQKVKEEEGGGGNSGLETLGDTDIEIV
jgi:hypothetical protein